MRKRPLTLALLVMLLLSAATVSARRFMQADTCHIDADTTINETLFVLCQDLTIDGTLNGNLIGAATTITLNGTVRDSVYLLGGQFDQHGDLGENLHYVGLVLNMHDRANFTGERADVFALTMSSHLYPEASLSGSLVGGGYQAILDGDIGGEVSFWGSALELDGAIGQGLTADVGDSDSGSEGTAELETLFLFLPIELNLVPAGLRMGRDASIGGDLRYRAPSLGAVRPAGVEGNIFFEQTASSPQLPNLSDEATLRKEFARYVGVSLREFVTLFSIGFVALLFTPVLFQAPLRNLRRRPLTSLGVGTLTFLLSLPVVVIAVVLSVLVVLTLALFQFGNLTLAAVVVLTLLDVGGASLFYFVAIFVARSVVCLALGRRVLRLLFTDDGSSRFLYASLALGALLISFWVSLPVIGWILNGLVLFLGLGAIVNLVQAQLRNLREGNGRLTHAEPLDTHDFYTVNMRVPARPRRLNGPTHTVGLDDLPDGFTWWDD